MTESEQDARRMIGYSKSNAKGALAALDASPADPVAKAMLAAIDALDKAAVELQKREGGAR